jgi:Protein of unknown function (DUF4238)
VAERANQHFVPRFYFRMFTGGTDCIHVLLTKTSRLVFNAPIKGQCARHRFYGPDRIEAALCELEGRCSVALKKMRDWVSPGSMVTITPADYATVLTAVLLQRSRTELEVNKQAPAAEALRLELFKEYLKHAPEIDNREAILECIESGHITITAEPSSVVAQRMATGLAQTALITDLDFHLLRNQTDYPFIFSDSPVVFHNRYYERVTERGVLGLQTPGLLVIYPLGSRTLFMLVDHEVYGGSYLKQLVIDVNRRYDVSRLNALQLHHSENAVYFADASASEYVVQLWEAEKRRIIPPKDRFEKRRGWLVHGQPTDDTIYQVFERLLNVNLDLSFIHCTPIDPSKYVFRRRSPTLVLAQENRAHRESDDSKKQLGR